MLVAYFVYIAHVEAYFLWIKILAHGNIRRRKRTLGNEKREKKGQRREKEYHSVEIGKSLMKATGTPLHPGVQMRSPSNQN